MSLCTYFFWGTVKKYDKIESYEVSVANRNVNTLENELEMV